MLQNEGCDHWGKNQYATCALASTSPKEGEGGGSRVGCVLDVSPSVTFLKVYFGPTNFLLLFLIPGKPCWFCCVNLSVLQFKFVGGLSCVWQ